MKLIFTTIILFLGLAQASQAGDLPELKNVVIEVDNGPALAAVQPTATLNFSIASCDPRKLKLVAEKKNDTVFITVLDLENFDCRGVLVERDYSFLISSDASRETYVVLNPLAPVIE